jgi:hypothetical protein
MHTSPFEALVWDECLSTKGHHLRKALTPHLSSLDELFFRSLLGILSALLSRERGVPQLFMRWLVVRMTLHLFNNVFRLNLAFESTERIL